MNKKEYWEKIYQSKQPDELSWFDPNESVSIEYIKKINLPVTSRIFDNGGGDGFFANNLLKLGYDNITVLDISETAIKRAKKFIGENASQIKWIVDDITECESEGQFDLWHDRATFHFLTKDKEIKKYVSKISKCINPGGYLIIATFSEQGPKKCSGLDIQQYSEESMTELLKDSFEKIECKTVDHITPSNAVQNFLYCLFRKK
jgi:2-polyprenyl-3-methyl-5-hydroxy-6-metoxy-1,4-benzoquinol methylase